MSRGGLDVNFLFLFIVIGTYCFGFLAKPDIFLIIPIFVHYLSLLEWVYNKTVLDPKNAWLVYIID